MNLFKRKKNTIPSSEVPINSNTSSFNLSVIRYDKLDAFGAYLSPSIKNGKGLILLNVEGTFGACLENGIKPKELIVEILMHEVGHALEEWYDIEFSEERIEKIIEEYQRKNNW